MGKRARPPRLSIRFRSAKQIDSEGGHCAIGLDFEYADLDDRPEDEWPAENRRAAGILARIAAHAEPFVRAQQMAHGCRTNGGRIETRTATDPLAEPMFRRVETGEPAEVCEVYAIGILAGEHGAGIGFVVPVAELALWRTRIIAWVEILAED